MKEKIIDTAIWLHDSAQWVHQKWAENPHYGAVTAGGGSFIAFIKTSFPIMQWIGTTIGVLLGCISLFEWIRKTFFKKPVK